MSFFKEIRLRARHVIGPVLGISAVTYFGFHAVQGDRGLMAWWKLRQHIEVASINMREVNKKIC